MSRSMQLHYNSFMAFSYADLFLERISLEWDFRGSAMTNHKKLIDVTASLDRSYLSFTKEKGILKIDQSVKMPWHRLSMGIACSYSLAPGTLYQLFKLLHNFCSRHTFTDQGWRANHLPPTIELVSARHGSKSVLRVNGIRLILHVFWVRHMRLIV